MIEFDEGNRASNKMLDEDLCDDMLYLQRQKALELWFQTTCGRALIANQRLHLRSHLERCYGFHQAEIGVSHRIPVGNASSLGHRFSVVPTVEAELPENTVVSNSTELALAHDVADMVILHHALDFSADPHQTLREASRILKPQGNLVLVGFNPFSVWGILKLLKRSKGPVWGSRFLSGRRVSDWLSLLDFKVASIDYQFYEMPLNSPKMMGRFTWLEGVLNSKVPLGAYYIIMAQKQQGARINMRSTWQRKAKVIGLPVANRTKPHLKEDQ